MKIFTDFHHHALLQSLILLFEKRLGGEVYRPIGLEWYEEGYWNVYPHTATANQYLNLDQRYMPEDGTPPLNEIIGKDALEPPRRGKYFCKDIDGDSLNKAITLEAFKEIKFDILIASLPQHIEPFKKLISLYQPQAKLIYQIGNQWNVDSNIVKNVMASANVDIPAGINGVVYHQEFDLTTFYPTPIDTSAKKIYSFINCLNVVDIYKKDWELFLTLEKLMPDWEFKSFGGQCRDGAIHDTKQLAEKMREATFIFHCKTDGDGYGHVIHNAAAVGRPLITRKVDYIGKLAGSLIHNLRTAVTVDNLILDELKYRIIHCYDNGLNQMSKEIRQIFDRTVDFPMEERKIRKFIENLQ